MVNATIDNEVISIQLEFDESVTVPDNQVWSVWISGGDSAAELLVNGIEVWLANEDNSSTGTTGGDKFVFASGDKIETNSNVNISGFVVND